MGLRMSREEDRHLSRMKERENPPSYPHPTGRERRQSSEVRRKFSFLRKKLNSGGTEEERNSADNKGGERAMSLAISAKAERKTSKWSRQ